MRHRQIPQYLIAVLTLVLSACTPIYAATIQPTNQSNAPKCHVCKRYVAHLRDSLFHSYMDSLDFRIHELNDAAHRVDSLTRILKSESHVNLHLDGRTFEPFHIPEFTIPEINTPEVNIRLPKITLPRIDVPKIEIPDIDIPADDWLSDGQESSEASPESAMISGGPKIRINYDGPTIRIHSNGSATADYSTSQTAPNARGFTEYYYFNGERRYYIENPLWEQVNPIEWAIRIWPLGTK